MRRQAEEVLAKSPQAASGNLNKDLETLIHELQVHQIELEAVNEELLRSQEDLQKSRDRFRELYNSAPVGYINLDTRFIIIEANLTFQQMLEYEQSEIINQGISRFLAAESFPLFVQSMVKVTAHWTSQHYSLRKPACLEVQLKPKDDTAPFYALLNVYPWKSEDSDKTNLRISVTDISDLKKSQSALAAANAELKEKNKALEKYSGELESANLEMEAFSYSVSHDLRAPLRAINGFSQILQEDYTGQLDQKGNETLDRIREASRQMGKLIDGLLHLSTIIRREMDIVPVNISEMALSVATQLKTEFPERKLKFIIHPGLRAAGDPGLLRIVLQNLLENAVKYTSRQPDAVIEFGAIKNNEGQTYFVSDNGAGFNMAYSDKLFKPFQRLHNSSEFPGLGIGLATVQRIVHRHGGKVWAEGEVGKGAQFFFVLPYEAMQASQALF